MRILVTGGCGFMGSAVSRRLVELGHGVICLSRHRPKNPVRGARYERGSYGSVNVLDRVIRDVDVVCHFGSPPPGPSKFSLADMMRHVTDSYALFRMSVFRGVGRIVYPSSGGTAYGDPGLYPSRESETVIASGNPYAAAKVSVESFLSAITNGTNTSGISLRFSNVYGPGMGSNRGREFVSSYCRAVLSGKPGVVRSGTYRDFLYIDDAVSAAVLAATVAQDTSPVVNIGSGTCVSLSFVADLVDDFTGRRYWRRIMSTPPAGSVLRTCLDTSLANLTYGWRPSVGIVEGVRRTVEWISTNSKER